MWSVWLGRTIVYGSPLARTSLSERRFQSCASVARLYAPVRLVTLAIK